MSNDQKEVMTKPLKEGEVVITSFFNVDILLSLECRTPIA
jgi:hypothetical protein